MLKPSENEAGQEPYEIVDLRPNVWLIILKKMICLDVRKLFKHSDLEPCNYISTFSLLLR